MSHLCRYVQLKWVPGQEPQVVCVKCGKPCQDFKVEITMKRKMNMGGSGADPDRFTD